MKIAVTGATGQLGNLVVEQLKKRVLKENIVALVRTPEKASELEVEARAFDYSKPENLAGALSDIDTLLLISSNEIGQRAIQHANVIDAAKKAGIKWIVYTSLLHADTSTLSLAGEHMATEEALKASGIEYTLLRNGWYTENYTASVQGAIAGGGFIGSAADGKISSATRTDFAEAAAVVLDGDIHKGKVYELAGNESYTLTDLAAEISKQTGKNIPYNNLPESDYAKILKSFGLPDMLAQSLASWDISASNGDLFDDSHVLSKLIERPTTSLTEAVKQAIK